MLSLATEFIVRKGLGLQEFEGIDPDEFCNLAADRPELGLTAISETYSKEERLRREQIAYINGLIERNRISASAQTSTPTPSKTEVSNTDTSSLPGQNSPLIALSDVQLG